MTCLVCTVHFTEINLLVPQIPCGFDVLSAPFETRHRALADYQFYEGLRRGF